MNEDDLDNAKFKLEKMIKCFEQIDNTLDYSSPIDADAIISLNIIHFIIEKISIIKTFEPITKYSNILNLFLQLLLLLSDISTSSLNMLINENPIPLFWEIASIPISNIYIKSLKLIYIIVNSGQADDEIDFLLPHIFEEILVNKTKKNKIKYIMNLQPIISSYCENANQCILDRYVDAILDVTYELIKTKYYYYYCLHSLNILRKLQLRHYDLFQLNYDLFHSILNIIDESGLGSFYKGVIRIMNLSLFFVSKDDPRKELKSEILSHIDRIISMFKTFKDDIEVLIDIIDLLSNLIVDEQSIIQKLFDDECIPFIIIYYNKSIFRLRNSIIWLVWNMLYGCTSDQLINILYNDEVYEIIMSTLDYDDSEFLYLVSATIKLMTDKLFYSYDGSNSYIDNIIDRLQSNMENYNYEIKEKFHNDIPQLF